MRDWLIHIKRGEYASLQTQIREALVSAILDRQLDQQEPIPSTRKMAKSLGVSRNTVVLAYQGLMDDGYLLARQRRGYFVADKALEDHVPRENAKAGAERPKARRPELGQSGQKHPSQQAQFWRSRATGRIINFPSSMARWITPVSAGRVARLHQTGAGQEVAG